MNKEYKKLFTNTGLLTIGGFASSLLGMLLLPFYTNVLSTADYGISDLIVTTTSLLYPFTTMAIGEAIMRFSLDRAADHKSVYSIGIYTASIGFILVLLASPLLAKTSIGEYIGFFLAYYVCYCFHMITSYFVKGLEKVRIYSFAGLANSAIVIGCNLLFLIVFQMGIKGYLLASILGHALTTAYMFSAAKLYRYIVFPKQIDRICLKSMLLYSIPIIPNSISWWIANSSDKYMLDFFTDTSEVGIYSVSYRIPTIMMTVMGFFISAWQLSAVNDFGSEKSKAFFSDIYNKCFTLNALLAMGLIAFSKIFGGFLYSKEFFQAWQYVPVLVIANIFNVMSSFLGTVYTSAKQTKMLSISTMLGAVSNIVMNLILIPKIGAMGAAIATAFSYVVMFLVRIINSKKIIKLEFHFRRDVLIIILILIQAVIVCMDFPYSQIMGMVFLAIGMIVSYKMIVDIVNMFLPFLRKRSNSK